MYNIVLCGFDNEMEKISFKLKHEITNIYEMQSALKKAMEEGIDKGLKKRFGLKGGLITGGSIAAGMVIGSYISNILKKRMEESIIGKLVEPAQYDRRVDDRPLG